jgi:hypothetical protein
MRKFLLPLLLCLPVIAHADSSSSPNWWSKNGVGIYYQSVPANGNVGIGSSNPGTALDVQGTVRALGFVNSLTLISSQTLSSAGSVTFSNLNGTTKYLILFNLVQNTSTGALKQTFNGDSGSNYTWTFFGYTDVPGFDDCNGIGVAFNQLHCNVQTVGKSLYGNINFSQAEGTTVRSIGSTSFNDGSISNDLEAGIAYGFYNGAAALTSTLTISAGTVSGTVSLYAYN